MEVPRKKDNYSLLGGLWRLVLFIIVVLVIFGIFMSIVTSIPIL